jgi:hypothetical protein
MPVGQQNATHRHGLPTIEHSYVVQRLLGAAGLAGTGLSVARLFGRHQEVILTAVDHFGERRDDLVAAEPANQKLANLGYAIRLRNYWNFSVANRLELSASAATGRREQPLAFSVGAVNAAVARQSVLAVDVSYRREAARSWVVQAELMKQLNGGNVKLPAGTRAEDYAGPTRDFSGAYLYAGYRLSRRHLLGARWDWVQDPEADGARLLAGAVTFEFLPGEFTRLVAWLEHRSVQSLGSTNRILLQAVFGLGPHGLATSY